MQAKEAVLYRRCEREFQYPRSSGQSCKAGSTETRIAPPAVSVPSKFGPVVQVGRRTGHDELLLVFQYPRSSGQSCKFLPIEVIQRFLEFQYPRSSGQSCKLRLSCQSCSWSGVSVPSEFGPIVQDNEFPVELAHYIGFSTLGVRANRARPSRKIPIQFWTMFQYPRSSGQSCKRRRRQY